MRKILLSIAISSLLLGCRGEAVKPAIVSDAQMEQKIDRLLADMSLDDKVGQMTQLTLDVIGAGPNVYSSDFPFQLDQAMLDTVLTTYRVGSILNSPTNTPLDITTWHQVIKQIQDKALSVNGIPVIYGIDAIHGVTYTIGATMFPQQIGQGATFNRELVREAGRITAYEARASNQPWNFSPILDLGRDARWSRMWETYGEDTYLIAQMGAASVAGYQGADPNKVDKDHVAACLKHYMGYGASYSGKDRTPIYLSDNDLIERHFEPFKQAIRAGALSVMVNSGVINSLPVHIDYRLITQWLKEGLNWDGVVVTDWADINNVFSRDKIVATKKEAIKLAINAGIDMSMVPYEVEFCRLLKELAQEGEVPMARIDDAVRRVLRLKMRLGLFEQPYYPISDYPQFGSADFAAVATQTAEESITLLKNNDNLLPLNQNAKILVCGPNANSMRTMNGGWTLSWQGEKADIYATQYNTFLEALQNKFGTNRIVYEPGVVYNMSGKYYEEQTPQIARAVAAAAGCDVIMLFVGENSYCETPGNLDDLTLSPNQIQLAKALAKTGKPIVLVLNEGRPRVIREIEPLAAAILQTYLPGNYGGDALASTVSGDSNPSGRLPYTYPKYPNSLITYDHKPCERIGTMAGAYDYDANTDTQWSFGAGMSYTTFAYSDFTVDNPLFEAGDMLNFSVRITNTGNRAGKHSVLLFVADQVASLTPDVRRLRAFEKVDLQAGESRVVNLSVPANDLSFVDHQRQWRLEKGNFVAFAADQTVSLECKQTVTIDYK